MSISSNTDYTAIIHIINNNYSINVHKISLHRDMIGCVYFLEDNVKKYVLKIYRSFNLHNALQTIEILEYLKENEYPVVAIIPTVIGSKSITVDTPEGSCVGILFDYVDGSTPERTAEIDKIGQQIGKLHNIMQNYPQDLINRTKDEYINDYTQIMSSKNYLPNRIIDIQQYGDELWTRINKLSKGFCHGDAHTGNMIKTKNDKYVLFDFDDASGDYPIMDVAYMSNDTNFNRFYDDGYEKTMRMFERFYKGYCKERTLSDFEIKSIFDFIAVQHFQIVSRIVSCQGLQEVSAEFFDEQYGWLLNWGNLCERKNV